MTSFKINSPINIGTNSESSSDSDDEETAIKIVDGKIKELKAEKKTADQFNKVYSRSSKKLIKQLDDLLKQTDPAVLLNLQNNLYFFLR